MIETSFTIQTDKTSLWFESETYLVGKYMVKGKEYHSRQRLAYPAAPDVKKEIEDGKILAMAELIKHLGR